MLTQEELDQVNARTRAVEDAHGTAHAQVQALAEQLAVARANLAEVKAEAEALDVNAADKDFVKLANAREAGLSRIQKLLKASQEAEAKKQDAWDAVVKAQIPLTEHSLEVLKEELSEKEAAICALVDSFKETISHALNELLDAAHAVQLAKADLARARDVAVPEFSPPFPWFTIPYAGEVGGIVAHAARCTEMLKTNERQRELQRKNHF